MMGMQGAPSSASTSAVADLSLARRCAMRAVEADVVAEGEVARLAPAHRDQPAAGADIDGNAPGRAQ